MKKLFLPLLILTSVLVIPIAALADGGTKPAVIQIQNPLGEGATIETLINRILYFFIYQLGPLIALLMIVYSAYLLVPSGGDPAKVKTAKNTLLYTIIGFVLLIIATSVSSVVMDILGVSSPSTDNTRQIDTTKPAVDTNRQNSEFRLD